MSTTSSTQTASFSSTLGYATGYSNCLGDNLSFGISNDSRWLVTNSRQVEYSAIAYTRTKMNVLNSSGLFQIEERTLSSTFVDTTTFISCAHMACQKERIYEGNQECLRLYISGGVNVYPGVNSYYNGIYWGSMKVIGIASNYKVTNGTYVEGNFCKMQHILINLYMEVA